MQTILRKVDHFTNFPPPNLPLKCQFELHEWFRVGEVEGEPIYQCRKCRAEVVKGKVEYATSNRPL